jgi:ABC-2 type transport system permease protein
MNKILVVAKKELKGIIKTRSQMLIGIFFVIFLALFFTKTVISAGYAVSWVTIGAMLVVAVLLLALLSYLTRFLSKERIVTSIP